MQTGDEARGVFGNLEERIRVDTGEYVFSTFERPAVDTTSSRGFFRIDDLE